MLACLLRDGVYQGYNASEACWHAGMLFVYSSFGKVALAQGINVVKAAKPQEASGMCLRNCWYYMLHAIP